MQAHNPTNRAALIRFAIVFTLVAGVLYTLFNWLPRAFISDGISRQTAEATAFLLRSLGIEASASGALVSARGFAVRIIPECTAVFVAILFFAFVCAYPTSLKHKAIGLMFGLPFLYAANLVRVLVIFLVGLTDRTFMDYTHVYLGQIFMILLVLLAAMVWLRSLAAVSMQDRPLPFLVRFVCYSSLPFAIWFYLDQGFVLANLYAVKALLGLFGMQAAIPAELKLFPHTFNTFHLIAFTSLILATRSIVRAQKARSLAIGLAVLVGAQFLFRLHLVLYVDFHLKSAFKPLIALIIINQWLLPFGLWLYFVRRELFGQKDSFICPICGEEKHGLADHIRMKHGEGALRRLEKGGHRFLTGI